MVTDPRIEERYTADGFMDVFDVTIDHVDDQLAIFLIDLSDVWIDQAKGIDWEYVEPDQIRFKIAPPPSGYQVVIQTNAEETQELDLIQNDPLPPEALENALDKLTILSRQAENRANGALTYPDYTTGPYFLPSGGGRANRVFTHDAAGDALMLLPAEIRDGVINWQGGITYSAGAFVVNNSRMWSASVENTDSPPAAGSTDWKLVTTDFITDNMWQNDVDYPVGTIIAHTNASLFVPLPAVPVLWIAISPVVGSQPGDDPSQWELFAVPPAHQLRWSSDVTYEAGIVVMHNNRMWLASSNSKDIEPGTNDAAWLPHSDRGTASVSDDYTYDQDYRAFTLFVDTTTNPAPVITLSDPTLTDREVKVVVYGGGEANVVGTGINTPVKSDSAAEFIWTGTAWIALAGGGGGGAGLEVGETTWWPGAGNLPPGKLELDGTLQSISEYPALFGKLGTTWGGDGITTFGLPDLQGIFPGAIGVQGIHGDAGWNIGDIIEDSVGPHSATFVGNALASHRHLSGNRKENYAGMQNSTVYSYTTGAAGPTAQNPSLTAVGYLQAYSQSVTGGTPAGTVTQDVGVETRPASAMGRWLIQAAPSAPSEVNAVVVDVEISDVRWSPAITVGPNDMICDGSILSIQDYPELYDRIGQTFPGGDGSTTFALPNLEGIFPGAIGVQGTHGNAGNALGDLIEDSFESHTHIQNAHKHTENVGANAANANTSNPANSYRSGRDGDGAHCNYTVNSANNTVVIQNATAVNQNTGGAETRPASLMGNWIIRVTQPAAYVIPEITELFDFLYPVGDTVMQLPGTQSPADKGWPGTWIDDSASFAGEFFRVEGGDALAFEAGQQLDQMQRIYGQVEATSSRSVLPYESSASGAMSLGGANKTNSAGDSGAPTYPSILGFDSANSTVNGGARTGDETRPVNRTIRVWKRTA